jgi:hypothetical protein
MIPHDPGMEIRGSPAILGHMSPKSVDVLVVGAGHSGLAMSGLLEMMRRRAPRRAA